MEMVFLHRLHHGSVKNILIIFYIGPGISLILGSQHLIKLFG